MIRNVDRSAQIDLVARVLTEPAPALSADAVGLD